MPGAVARLTIAALCAAVATADLPVHCLHSATVGTWTFHMGTADHDNTVTCGHELPDHVMTMVESKVSVQNPGFEIASQYQVTLSDPNIATDNQGNKGTWTMIYDEGFDVVINNRKFFAFFAYQPKTEDARPDELEDFDSYCDQTFTGWFHTLDDKDWGCYIGTKGGEGAKALPKAVQTPIAVRQMMRGKQGKTQQIVQPTQAMLAEHAAAIAAPVPGPPGAADCGPESGIPCVPTTASSLMRFKETGRQLTTVSRHPVRGDEDDAFVPNMSLVELINSDDASTWTAQGNHEAFHGLTVRDMMKLLGRGRFKKQAKVAAVADDREDSVKYKGLPASWDWRNIDSGKYMTPVVEQGSCGSCYAIAATDVANMKLRIASKGKTRTTLSVQNVVSCSDYNQGCEGGYPLLVAKFAEDLGWVPTECQHYVASDATCDMTCFDDPSKVWKATNYEYIGGYYGACSEVAMMKALMKSPIVVALNAPGDLFYYGGGVYSSNLDTSSKAYDRVGDSRWEKTNHAVIAVGWGVEPAQNGGEPLKYWAIKNSWGAQWGNNGYFKLRRGRDDVAIESMSVNFNMIDPSGVHID